MYFLKHCNYKWKNYRYKKKLCNSLIFKVQFLSVIIRTVTKSNWYSAGEGSNIHMNFSSTSAISIAQDVSPPLFLNYSFLLSGLISSVAALWLKRKEKRKRRAGKKREWKGREGKKEKIREETRRDETRREEKRKTRQLLSLHPHSVLLTNKIQHLLNCSWETCIFFLVKSSSFILPIFLFIYICYSFWFIPLFKFQDTKSYWIWMLQTSSLNLWFVPCPIPKHHQHFIYLSAAFLGTTESMRSPCLAMTTRLCL